MKFIDPGFKGTNPGHYSAAVVSHGMLYVSGQLSINPDTREPCTGGIREHAALALDNLDRILKAAGVRRDQVVFCRVYIQNAQLPLHLLRQENPGDDPRARLLLRRTF